QHLPHPTVRALGPGSRPVMGGLVADLLSGLESPGGWAICSALARQPCLPRDASSRRQPHSRFDLRRSCLLHWQHYFHPDIGRMLVVVWERQQRKPPIKDTHGLKLSSHATERRWEISARA